MRTSTDRLFIAALLLLLLATSALSKEQREVSFDNLIQADKVMYVDGEKAPFTGIGVAKWPNGKVRQRVSFIKGVGQGPTVVWHENGQKWMAYDLRNGQCHGWRTEWDKMGKQLSRKYFKDGKESTPPPGSK